MSKDQHGTPAGLELDVKFLGSDHPVPSADAVMRQFESGATRHTDEGKLDYEGFLSPHVLKRYAEYLDEHRTQADGKLRDSDNWQQGIPLTVYMKSMLRHMMDVWGQHREENYAPPSALRKAHEDALCAVMFNVMGYLYEILKERNLYWTKEEEVHTPLRCDAAGTPHAK